MIEKHKKEIKNWETKGFDTNKKKKDKNSIFQEILEEYNKLKAKESTTP